MFNYFTHALDNGLRIVFIPTNTLSVVLKLFLGVGSKHETAKTNGISHFLEHMAFKGTKKRPNSLDIWQTLDRIGAKHNAGTSRETTSYYIKSIPEHLELMFDVTSDITFNSLFEKKEIDKEKRTIIEEFNMYQDDYLEKVGDHFRKIVFGNNPLGRKIEGEKKTVLKLERKGLVNYRNRFYIPNNMILTVAGGVKGQDWKKIVDLSNKWFGQTRKKKLRKRKIVWQSDKNHQLIENRQTEQTHLVFGVPTFGLSDSRRWQAIILAIILGGNASSRLFYLIREKRGWAYYIYASTETYQETGYLAVRAGIRNDRAKETLKIFKKEMINLAKTVTRKEVKEAKDYLLGRLSISFELPEDVVGPIARSWLLEEKMCTFEEILEKIKKVTLANIRSLASDLFKKDKFYLAAIGPNKNLTIKS